MAIEGNLSDIASCPTVPSAVALERQTVPPVVVERSCTLNCAETDARTLRLLTPEIRPCGLTPETLR